MTLALNSLLHTHHSSAFYLFPFPISLNAKWAMSVTGLKDLPWGHRDPLCGFFYIFSVSSVPFHLFIRMPNIASCELFPSKFNHDRLMSPDVFYRFCWDYSLSAFYLAFVLHGVDPLSELSINDKKILDDLHVACDLCILSRFQRFTGNLTFHTF